MVRWRAVTRRGSARGSCSGRSCAPEDTRRSPRGEASFPASDHRRSGGIEPCRRTSTRHHSIGALVLALAVIVAPEVAEAHAVLVRSNPTGRATLSHSPRRVDLWFSEPLEPAFCSVSVWSATGAQVDRGDGAVSPADPKRLSATLDALGPGDYTVRFRVLSVDGHVVEASLVFTVKTAP